MNDVEVEKLAAYLDSFSSSVMTKCAAALRSLAKERKQLEAELNRLQEKTGEGARAVPDTLSPGAPPPQGRNRSG